MALRIHLRVGLEDPSIRPDDVRDALRRVRRGRVARAVRHSDLALHVAEKGERKRELLREGGILGRRVERDPPDLGVLFLEFRVEVAEPATLQRSTGGVRLRIEKQHHRLPAEVP